MRPRFIFLLCLCSSLVRAQYFVWEQPVAVTDSSSDNTNAIIEQVEDNGTGKVYMFWEKAVDSSGSEIWFRLLHPAGSVPDSAVLSQPNVHFRHPVMVSFHVMWPPDTVAYLFYETDQAGDFDLYYYKLRYNGTFFGPFPFATGPGDQQSLSGIDAIQSHTAITWEDNGKVMVSNMLYAGYATHFTEPVVIDSIGAHHPVMAMGFNQFEVYYLKESGGVSAIHKASGSSVDTLWNAPAAFYTQGDNEALGIGSSVISFSTPFVCWQSLQQGTWGTCYWDLMDNVMALNAWSPLYNRTSPSCFHWMPGVKNSDTWGFLFDTYATDPIGNAEIMAEDAWGMMPLINLSNSPTQERHPAFYFSTVETSPYPAFRLYDVWESYRQGHWVLYLTMCPVPVPGNIVMPDHQDHSKISVSPNPFSDACRISFSVDSPGEVTLLVVNAFGQEANRLHQGFCQQGDVVLTWDGTDNQGNSLSPGLYLVKVIQGSGELSVKVLLTR